MECESSAERHTRVRAMTVQCETSKRPTELTLACRLTVSCRLDELAITSGGRGSDVLAGQHGLAVAATAAVQPGPVPRRRRPAQPQMEEVCAVQQRPAREGRAAAARLEVPVAPAVQLLVRRHAEADHLEGKRGLVRAWLLEYLEAIS